MARIGLGLGLLSGLPSELLAQRVDAPEGVIRDKLSARKLNAYQRRPGGVDAIRKRLRALAFIRNTLLEGSWKRKYAFDGRLELLTFDTLRAYEGPLELARQYRKIVAELLELDWRSDFRDPGTQHALARAMEWGYHTALAMPYHIRFGYARIDRILGGPDENLGGAGT